MYQEREINSPARYNNIDPYWMIGMWETLEIGCSDGTAQLASVHADQFREWGLRGHYTGIEIREVEPKIRGIVGGTNILEWEPVAKKFDLVLCIHVLEHIHYRHWPSIFRKIEEVLSHDYGRLIIGVPYKQSLEDYGSLREGGHVVFDISEEDFEEFTTEFDLVSKKVVPVNRFNGDGVGLAHAHARYLKRVLTRNPYRHNGESLYMLWERY